jgi:pimeloyl-ACP methyl ester carboxylesterase
MSKTAVLVHGAWHGAWCWELVVPKLAARGIDAVTVDLPSVQRRHATVADDADEVRRAIDAIGGPVVLVGHSYGGAVVTDAGAHPDVEHIVYLTAFALDDGESVSSNALLGGESMRLVEALRFEADVSTVDPDRATDFFFHDCSPDIATAAVARLRPMSLDAMRSAPRAVAWRNKPATYIVCTDDRGVPVELQRSAAGRCAAVIEIPTSHSPFLSQPELLADTLAPFLT